MQSLLLKKRNRLANNTPNKQRRHEKQNQNQFCYYRCHAIQHPDGNIHKKTYHYETEHFSSCCGNADRLPATECKAGEKA